MAARKKKKTTRKKATKKKTARKKTSKKKVTKKKSTRKKATKKTTTRKKAKKKVAKKKTSKKKLTKKKKKTTRKKVTKKAASKKKKTSSNKKANKKKVAKKKTSSKKQARKKTKNSPKAARKTTISNAQKNQEAREPSTFKKIVNAVSSKIGPSNAAPHTDHELIGKALPSRSLIASDGKNYKLSELAQQEKTLIIFFYPKDDTPGCTKEACDFRDSYSELQNKGATIVGISPDTLESHERFASKYDLNFPLLADTDHALAEDLGVWKEKSFMGRSYMGIERSTFLIRNGKIAKVWQPVKVEGHAESVLSELS